MALAPPLAHMDASFRGGRSCDYVIVARFEMSPLPAGSGEAGALLGR